MLVIHSNTSSHLTVLKRMNFGSFKNVINKMCDNTRFCSSLHKLLSPRLNTYVGRIKARSRFTDKRTKTQQELVVKTSREDRERVTLCG